MVRALQKVGNFLASSTSGNGHVRLLLVLTAGIEIARALRLEGASSHAISLNWSDLMKIRPAAAARVGFADQAHLTRAFKARLGVAPGAYRRAQQ